MLLLKHLFLLGQSLFLHVCHHVEWLIVVVFKRARQRDSWLMLLRLVRPGQLWRLLLLFPPHAPVFQETLVRKIVHLFFHVPGLWLLSLISTLLPLGVLWLIRRQQFVMLSVIAVRLVVITIVGFLASGGVGVLVRVQRVLVVEWSIFAVLVLLNMLQFVQRHQVVVVESKAVFVVMVSQQGRHLLLISVLDGLEQIVFVSLLDKGGLPFLDFLGLLELELMLFFLLLFAHRSV